MTIEDVQRLTARILRITRFPQFTAIFLVLLHYAPSSMVPEANLLSRLFDLYMGFSFLIGTIRDVKHIYQLLLHFEGSPGFPIRDLQLRPQTPIRRSPIALNLLTLLLDLIPSFPQILTTDSIPMPR